MKSKLKENSEKSKSIFYSVAKLSKEEKIIYNGIYNEILDKF